MQGPCPPPMILILGAQNRGPTEISTEHRTPDSSRACGVETKIALHKKVAIAKSAQSKLCCWHKVGLEVRGNACWYDEREVESVGPWCIWGGSNSMLFDSSFDSTFYCKLYSMFYSVLFFLWCISYFI